MDDYQESAQRVRRRLCEVLEYSIQEVAEKLGMILRATGKVKRGLGTIRQDLNVSIRGGAIVEIKGVQELEIIAKAVKNEVQRQLSLLLIRDELKESGTVVNAAEVDPGEAGREKTRGGVEFSLETGPSGIALDPTTGYLYVSDPGDGRVVVFTS